MSVLLENIQHFDLQQIMDSGQCFRMRKLSDKSYFVPSGNKAVQIDVLDTPGSFLFHCEKNEMKYWQHYFNLDHDYYTDVLNANPDPFLRDALEYGQGIRILRQDAWEVMVSFIISQNNNIPRIKQSVEALCERYGHIGYSPNGIPFYIFPAKLCLPDVHGLGLGYREAYLDGLRDVLFTRNLFLCDYQTAKAELMKIKGIGSKVADCICLYGMHKMYAYPIDTWMRKMIDDVYAGHFDITPYGNCAGYVQQIQFYYYRSLHKKG